MINGQGFIRASGWNPVMVWVSWNTSMVFSQSRLMHYLNLWQENLEGTIKKVWNWWVVVVMDDVQMISCAAINVKVKTDNFHIIKYKGKYRRLLTSKTNAVVIESYCRHRIIIFKATESPWPRQACWYCWCPSQGLYKWTDSMYIFYYSTQYFPTRT